MKRRILLTNDDGWNAPGIIKLYEFFKSENDVTVIAPSGERSAIAHSISLGKEVVFTRESNGFISVSGTPTDCVSLGVRSFMKAPPDLLVSGINLGPNMGDDITYSGTVAAAMEGCILGIPSISISINSKADFNFNVIDNHLNEIIDKYLESAIPAKTFININYPNIETTAIKGIQVTSLGHHTYFDNIEITEESEKRIIYLNKHAAARFEDIEGTDFWAVDRGYISITPIKLDLTNYNKLEYFKEVLVNHG